MVVLIAGVTGQDGALLAKQLVDAGVSVVGTTRDAASADRRRLVALDIDEQIKLVSMLPTDYRSVLHTLSQHAPDEVYFLAEQTSVGMSFDQPVEAILSTATGVLNILEAIRFLHPKVRLLTQARECFGTPAVRLLTQTPRSDHSASMRLRRPVRTIWSRITGLRTDFLPAPEFCLIMSPHCGQGDS